MCVTAHALEGRVIEIADRDSSHLERAGVAAGELVGHEGLGVDRVDDGIGEEACGEASGVLAGGAADVVSRAGRDADVDIEHLLDGFADGLGGGVHDAGEGVDLDEVGVGIGGKGAFDRDLDDRVHEDAGLDSLELSVVEFSFQKIDARGGDVAAGEAHGGGGALDAGGARVSGGLVRSDLDAVHAWSILHAGIVRAVGAGQGPYSGAMSSLPTVQLFTDGACSGNPGPGGWAFILRHPASGKELERAGAELETTNNRMELIAVIEGLKALTTPSRVELTSDSQYVLNGLKEWLSAWKARGWRTASKKPVKNEDLWRALDELASRHDIRFHWIRGHRGHAENERCDQLAVAAREALIAGE